MKPPLLLLACGAAIVFVPPVWAGLDLSWNACNLAPGATTRLDFACADPDSSQHLFGSFQLPADMSGFLAMDLFIDVKSASSALPPSWHYEPDGCNDGALTLSAARPPGNEVCENPWGVGGATALIVAYEPGFGGDPSRARLVASVFRQRSRTLTAGTNYYAFDLAFLMGNASCCSGCETAAEIVWSAGRFYDSTGTSVVVQGPGLQSDCVAVNGPGCFVRLSSSTPDPLDAESKRDRLSNRGRQPHLGGYQADLPVIARDPLSAPCSGAA